MTLRRPGKSLVPVDRSRCPTCDGPIENNAFTEKALVRHAGYGASRTTEHVWCQDCGWSLIPNVSEVNPR